MKHPLTSSPAAAVERTPRFTTMTPPCHFSPHSLPPRAMKSMQNWVSAPAQSFPASSLHRVLFSLGYRLSHTMASRILILPNGSPLKEAPPRESRVVKKKRLHGDLNYLTDLAVRLTATCPNTIVRLRQALLAWEPLTGALQA